MCYIQNRMHTATHYNKNFYVGHGCSIVNQMQMDVEPRVMRVT